MPFTSTNFKVEGSDGRHWTLLEPFTYVTAIRGPLEPIVVPAGAQFDGASTPQAIWNAIPPFGPGYWKAACLHDYLYRATTMSREDADWIFNEAMESLGCDPLLRQTIYKAVRYAGQHAFEEDRAE
jgi:hypothetical protein